MAITPKKNPDKKYSYADYCSWNDDKRYEIIDGVVYDMNAPMRVHQIVLQELFIKFHNYLDNKPCEVYLAPFDVRLPKRSKKDDKIDTVVQPDIAVICDETKLDEHGCVGAPNLIVEILSPSTAGKDHITKRRLYEQHKVKEYWLVHPVDKIITIYRLADNTFDKADIYDDSSEIKSSILPDFILDTKTIFPVIEKKVSSPPPKEYRI